MTARCMSCGDSVEIGNTLALMLERAEARLVLNEDGHVWADVLVGVVREKTHRCDKPRIGLIDLRAVASRRSVVRQQ